MRIALCLEYPLAYQGGVSVLCRALATGLAGRHELVLVSPDSPEEFARLRGEIPFASHVAWNPDAATREQARSLIEALLREKIQVAHFHFGGNFGWGNRVPGRCPIPFLARRGVAVVSTVHLVVGALDGYCGPHRSLVFKLALWPVAWLGKVSVLRHLRSELVVSEFGARCLRRWYWPWRTRIQTVYHSRFSERQDSGSPAPPREKMVLYAGHIAERKGQHVLAAAFARVAPRHPEWRLVLLGDGERAWCDRIRSIAAEHRLEDRVQMPGSRPDALEWMRRAEIFVQPSFFEGLPLALQEAMLSGCACLATDIHGNDELILSGETGLLTGKGNPVDMAAALERLMGDPALREVFRRRGPASVLAKGMSLERMIQRHFDLYESFV